MTSQVSIPILPFAPAQYEQRYMDEFVRMLTLYFQQLQTPGPLRGNTLVLTRLPTSAAGLPSGSIWVDTANSYVLKMVP